MTNGPVKVILMADEREGTIDTSKKGNVKIDIPPDLNDPKFERTDVPHMTDEYKRQIGK
jgi:hypothetical protein